MNAFLFLADFDIMSFLQGESFLTALKSLGLAIVVWIVGSIVINKVVSIIAMSMEKANFDASLRPFLVSMIGVLLKVLLMLAVASTLGMEVTSFVAILSAAAFAIGMALQGGLANFAGGVMILIFKPFKIGDLLTAQGFTGSVKEIQIFNTLLETLDNEIIIIPNGPLSNGTMTNHSKQGKRGIAFTFGIAYDADIDAAKKVIMEVAATCKEVINLNESGVVVAELGDSSVNLAVRLWADPADWWTVFFYMNEHVKKAFDKNNIGIPYPTMDVNISK
ncbi:MAG: Small-conductance mechanosensitive channel [uncultured Aureispira sp.]|uniref:Small-conductance mechanosensitive channel n=1 Tax=uncultured Aureispira sp. TaxID=1331704 RepID=A0A6S6S7U6_9BACT|nr:MAG: Small-conductance mechanosensitive channel [uncultured Aureispira sp.]